MPMRPSTSRRRRPGSGGLGNLASPFVNPPNGFELQPGQLAGCGPIRLVRLRDRILELVQLRLQGGPVLGHQFVLGLHRRDLVLGGGDVFVQEIEVLPRPGLGRLHGLGVVGRHRGQVFQLRPLTIEIGEEDLIVDGLVGLRLGAGRRLDRLARHHLVHRPWTAALLKPREFGLGHRPDGLQLPLPIGHRHHREFPEIRARPLSGRLLEDEQLRLDGVLVRGRQLGDHGRSARLDDLRLRIPPNAPAAHDHPLDFLLQLPDARLPLGLAALDEQLLVFVNRGDRLLVQRDRLAPIAAGLEGAGGEKQHRQPHDDIQPDKNLVPNAHKKLGPDSREVQPCCPTAHPKRPPRTNQVASITSMVFRPYASVKLLSISPGLRNPLILLIFPLD